MLNKDTLNLFDQIKISELSRKDIFGSRSFDEVLPILKQIYDMISEEIIVIQSVSGLPKEFINQVESKINELNSFNMRIRKIDFDRDASQNFNERNSVISDIHGYYNEIISGRNNFLTIYNAIKLLGIQDVDQASSKYTELKNKIETEIEKVTKLEDTLRREASKETLSDYAKIFEVQAKQHSNFSFKKNG
jgi:hypothetical protein